MSSTFTKKTCPLTLAEFLAAAPKTLVVSLESGAPPADAAIELEPKRFDSGSVGLWGQGKITVTIGGKPVSVHVGCNLTVVGTKANAKVTPEQAKAKGDEAFAGLTRERLSLYFGAQGDCLGEAREFSTGSFGWNVNAKLPTKDGKHTLQVGINATVVASKEAPRA